MTFLQSLQWAWHDWSLLILFLVGTAIISTILAIIVYRRIRKKDPNEPINTVDEFDKSGYVHVYEIDKEAEGSAFLFFERASGDIEHRQIGQPFTFYMDDGSIERHHLNARGSYRCLNPEKLFESYKPTIKEINQLAHLTEQHIRTLRTGAYANEKLSRHLRMFVLLFLLSGMCGIGIAAAIVRH